MTDHDDAARHYLAALRGDRWDDAYHSLIEMGAAARPVLTDALRNERDLRQIVLRILWQSRSNDVVPLLAEALDDEDPHIWKEALDGLVAIGATVSGPAALDVLRAARRRADAQRAEWFDEAIEQISERR